MTPPLPAVAESVGRKVAEVRPELVTAALGVVDNLATRHGFTPQVKADVTAALLRAHAASLGIKV